MANQANQAATAKITDLETRFQTLTAEQQQDAEVIDARDGETSLRARLDRDHAEFAKLSSYAEYSKNSTQSIAPGVQTTLALTEVETNENVTFLSGTNEIQIVNAGQYEIKVQLKTSAAATNGFGIYPRRNGANLKYFISQMKNFQHSFFCSLNVNDKITFVVLHYEASAIDVISDSETYFQIKKVG